MTHSSKLIKICAAEVESQLHAWCQLSKNTWMFPSCCTSFCSIRTESNFLIPKFCNCCCRFPWGLRQLSRCQLSRFCVRWQCMGFENIWMFAHKIIIHSYSYMEAKWTVFWGVDYCNHSSFTKIVMCPSLTTQRKSFVQILKERELFSG